MNGVAVRTRQIGMIIAAILISSSMGLAQAMKIRAEADHLRVAGPQLRFVSGRALEKLHNGAAVTYQLVLTIRSERAGRVLARVMQRFTVSYDLWEEKFSVTRLDSPTRSASNLKDGKVEAWCLDNLAVPLTEVPSDRPFWVRLEFETEQPRDPSAPDDSGLTLSSLIDIFSRRSHEEQQRGFDEIGPMTLSELKRK